MNVIKNLGDVKTDVLRNRNTGTVAWLLHRLTGLALVFYIGLHLGVLGSELLFGQGAFDRLMGSFKQPVFKFLEVCLIAVVGFHLLNGLRIILADFLQITRAQKVLFWIVIVFLVIGLSITGVVFFS